MPRRKDTPVPDDDYVSETDIDDVYSALDVDENDENVPLNSEHDPAYPSFLPAHRSSLLVLRTPLSHSHASRDTPLLDITDQFFHPPSPSPVRVSKLKRSAPHTAEPPRRPKKPKSLAYPADPPNWLCSRSSSSLPPSSPFPPSIANVEYTRSAGRPTTSRYEYHLGTPSKASDSDPFGFVAVERALKAKRVAPALAPYKPGSRLSAVKSPPRSTVLSRSHPPILSSLSHVDAPVPTNNEDIEGLYSDEPIAGPSRPHVPAAPLLRMNSDQPYVQADPTCSQPTFPDPLRTPRKRKRRISLTLGGDLDSDTEGSDIPSSPSPVKVSVGVRHSSPARSSYAPVAKLTRAQTRAAAKGNTQPPTKQSSRTKRVKTSYQHIPTPSSTPASVRPSSSVRQSTAPPTPVPPRRSTRQAVVGARAKPMATTTTTNNREDEGRMRLRSRNVKTNVETKTTKPTTRTKTSRSKAPARTQTTTVTTKAKPVRGRPKGKQSSKNIKGKGKARSLENVLDLSDDTRERYEKERRERLEYYKRLEGYQIQKENVYVV